MKKGIKQSKYVSVLLSFLLLPFRKRGYSSSVLKWTRYGSWKSKGERRSHIRHHVSLCSQCQIGCPVFFCNYLLNVCGPKSDGAWQHVIKQSFWGSSKDEQQCAHAATHPITDSKHGIVSDATAPMDIRDTWYLSHLAATTSHACMYA